MREGLIVMFHEFSDAAWFEASLRFLKETYTLVSLKEFENPTNLDRTKKFCHITFDDGHRSFYEKAFPLLKKYEAPATLFVSPLIMDEGKNFWFQEAAEWNEVHLKKIIARVSGIPESLLVKAHPLAAMKCLRMETIQKILSQYKENFNPGDLPAQNMNLEQLKEVDASGLICIGGHTLIHPILANENDSIAESEITTCILRLEEILGHSIEYFAYPNGIPNMDYGKREIEVLKKNNIRAAVSSQSKYVEHTDDVYQLPRISISHGSNMYLSLKLLMGGAFDKLQSLRTPDECTQRTALYPFVNAGL